MTSRHQGDDPTQHDQPRVAAYPSGAGLSNGPDRPAPGPLSGEVWCERCERPTAGLIANVALCDAHFIAEVASLTGKPLVEVMDWYLGEHPEQER